MDAELLTADVTICFTVHPRKLLHKGKHLMDNSALIAKLFKFVSPLGRITTPKNKKFGFVIYEPKAFDATKLAELTESLDLQFVHDSQPSYHEGRQIPPRLWIGEAKASLSQDEFASAFLSR